MLIYKYKGDKLTSMSPENHTYAISTCSRIFAWSFWFVLLVRVQGCSDLASSSSSSNKRTWSFRPPDT